MFAGMGGASTLPLGQAFTGGTSQMNQSIGAVPLAISTTGETIINEGLQITNSFETGSVTLNASDLMDIDSTYTLTFPVDAGTNGQFLQTDGLGTLSFAAASTSGDITGITSVINGSFTKLGTAADQEYIDFSTSNEVNIKINNTERLSVTSGGSEITGILSLKNGSTSSGSLELYEDSDNGTNKITIIAPSSIGSDYTLTLPSDDGDADQVLSTNGSGVLSWVANSGGGGGGGGSGDITAVSLTADSGGALNVSSGAANFTIA